MQAYQTDAAGRYTGPVECDPDPLDPGRWLVPGGAVLAAPPAVGAGQRPRWTGARWVIEPDDLVTPDGGGEHDLASLYAAQDARRSAAMLAARHGGAPFRGALVASDPVSMTMLLGMTRRAKDALADGSAVALAIYAAELGAGWRGWSPADGVTVVAASAAEMVELETAVVAWIRHCDDVSQAHAAALRALRDAGDVAGLLVYGVGTGYADASA